MHDTDSSAVMERETMITNKEGLHFRPIMQFVDLVSRFSSRITVRCEDRGAAGNSPMELLMLMATQGTKLKLVAQGADAAEALNALVGLIEAGFYED